MQRDTTYEIKISLCDLCGLCGSKFSYLPGRLLNVYDPSIPKFFYHHRAHRDHREGRKMQRDTTYEIKISLCDLCGLCGSKFLHLPGRLLNVYDPSIPKFFYHHRAHRDHREGRKIQRDSIRRMRLKISLCDLCGLCGSKFLHLPGRLLNVYDPSIPKFFHHHRAHRDHREGRKMQRDTTYEIKISLCDLCGLCGSKFSYLPGRLLNVYDPSIPKFFYHHRAHRDHREGRKMQRDTTYEIKISLCDLCGLCGSKFLHLPGRLLNVYDPSIPKFFYHHRAHRDHREGRKMQRDTTYEIKISLCDLCGLCGSKFSYLPGRLLNVYDPGIPKFFYHHRAHRDHREGRKIQRDSIRRMRLQISLCDLCGLCGSKFSHLPGRLLNVYDPSIPKFFYHHRDHREGRKIQRDSIRRMRLKFLSVISVGSVVVNSCIYQVDF